MRVYGVYCITPTLAKTPLPIIASRLRTEIVDLTANHTLTQVFYNPSSTGPFSPPEAREAKYTFPIYESCAVRSFSAEIGSKFIRGVVKPKEKAKAIYDAAKAQGKKAALLEQNTSDVFTTSIGNIGPGEFVTIVIKYVHELKQDIEAEGVRLVVPTIITERYGSTDFTTFGTAWDNQWNNMSEKLEKIAEGKLNTKGMLAIEVIATMNGSIRGVQSPSHPISINIGSHDASGQGEFDPNKARAVLALQTASTTGLGKDFTLIINSTDTSMPRAFLAPHPNIPSKSTLLVTLVPRFELPQQQPEIIFVVDRSGSMTDKISTVRSALHLFLASLPVGVHFNIISFGSRHTSLWPKSKLYDADTFAAAKKYIDGMDADMGGTEMLAPCQQAVKSRLAGMNLEVLLLTDGDIWQTEMLFNFVNQSTASGDARFFSLGVGESVSHLLVEGIGRSGRGYSQIVGTNENMQKKIMRMLKSALTPHVNDWRIDWDGKPTVMSSFSQEKTPEPTVHATISLYDPSSNPDEAKPSSSTLPARPPILQTPATIPSLFSFTRTSVYILLTNCAAPKSIRLLGTARDPNTNSIHPLAHTIPVTTITSPSSALGLYSLLGRKLLQDLEEGRCSYLPANSPHKAAEGTDLGVKFGLASKWTSFVAVVARTDDSEDEAMSDILTPQGSDDDEPQAKFDGSILVGGCSSIVSLSPMMSLRASGLKGSSASPAATSSIVAPRQRAMLLSQNRESAEDSEESDDMGFALFDDSFNRSVERLECTGKDLTPSDIISRLSRLQLFSGHFELSQALLDIIRITENTIKGVGDWIKNGQESAWVSVVVVIWLRKRFPGHSEEWEMMADKAWNCAISEVGPEAVNKMEIEAGKIVEGAAE